jgi:hypothetical protein
VVAFSAAGLSLIVVAPVEDLVEGSALVRNTMVPAHGAPCIPPGPSPVALPAPVAGLVFPRVLALALVPVSVHPVPAVVLPAD